MTHEITKRLSALGLLELAHAACRKYGADFDDAFARRLRSKACVRARDFMIAHLRKHTSMSSPEIGRFFGGMDHTSILEALRRHAERDAEAAE